MPVPFAARSVPRLGFALLTATAWLVMCGSTEAQRTRRAPKASPPKAAARQASPPKEAKPGADDTCEGVIKFGSTEYKLTYVVAYEARQFDDLVTKVMLSSAPIPVDKLNASLAKNGTDEDFFTFEPHVSVTFKDGAASFINAFADGRSLSLSSDKLSGNVESNPGRARGGAKLLPDPEDEEDRRVEFELKFDAALVTAAPKKPKSKAGAKGANTAGRDTVEGPARVQQKDYKLSHGMAYPTKSYGEDVLKVLMCAQPIPVDDLLAELAKEGTDDGFYPPKPYIAVTFKDGRAYVCNGAAGSYSFQYLGANVSGELTQEGGRVHGEAKLAEAEEDDEDRRSSCELTFDVALLEPAVNKAGAKPRKRTPLARSAEEDSEDEPAGVPNLSEIPGGAKIPGLRELLGEARDALDEVQAEVEADVEAMEEGEEPLAAIRAQDLPRPNDARDIEYKELVEQITYSSATDHKSLAKFLSKQLAAQGWKADGDDLIAAKSAILRRQRGEASLTIFVKPARGGSTVMMMTEGLSWDDADEGEAPEVDRPSEGEDDHE